MNTITTPKGTLAVRRGRIPRPQKVVIYGPEGVGKSTLAGQTPEPVFLDTEGGTQHLDVARFDAAATWEEITAAVAQLAKADHPFKTLVVDTADWLEKRLVEHLCRKANKESIEDFGYSANADSTVTVAPVTLNRHKYKTVHVTARESAETSLNALEALVEAAAQQLAQDVLVDIFSCITAANFGAPGIVALPATDFNYKKVLGIREACGTAKMPPNPRSLVLDSGYYTNMLADDIVAKSFNLNLNAPAVTEGMVKRLAGFNLHETTLIPPDHAEKLVGFAAHSSAVAVAMRYLQPVADYQQSGAVTDPTTGMTFGYLRFTDTRANKVFVTLECLYGFSAAKTDALKRIVKP